MVGVPCLAECLFAARLLKFSWAGMRDAFLLTPLSATLLYTVLLQALQAASGSTRQTCEQSLSPIFTAHLILLQRAMHRGKLSTCIRARRPIDAFGTAFPWVTRSTCCGCTCARCSMLSTASLWRNRIPHTTTRKKPLLLTEIMANGSLPKELAGVSISVHAVEYQKHKHRFCSSGGPPVRCFENFQRFMLVEALLQVAGPNDLALFGDVDEIARPSVVSMLAWCYPFDGRLDWHAPYYILRLTLLKFGLHCDHGNTFVLGTRAFSVAALRTDYGNYKTATPQRLSQMSFAFSHTRLQKHMPVIPEAGWHLTSLGEPWELERKMATWLHANIFVDPRSRDLRRIERCQRYCLELAPTRGQTDWPPCTSRDDPKSTHLPGRVITRLRDADLPAPLIHERSRYPSSWYRYVAD